MKRISSITALLFGVSVSLLFLCSCSNHSPRIHERTQTYYNQDSTVSYILSDTFNYETLEKKMGVSLSDGSWEYYLGSFATDDEGNITYDEYLPLYAPYGGTPISVSQFDTLPNHTISYWDNGNIKEEKNLQDGFSSTSRYDEYSMFYTYQEANFYDERGIFTRSYSIEYQEFEKIKGKTLPTDAVATPDDSLLDTVYISRTYDKQGNVLTHTAVDESGDGWECTYEYDSKGNLTRVQNYTISDRAYWMNCETSYTYE